MSEETVSFSLELNVGQAVDRARELQTAISHALNLTVKLTGDENLKKAVAGIQRYLAWLNRLRLAYRAVQLARMAAGDPLAWALAGISVVETGVSFYEATGQ